MAAWALSQSPPASAQTNVGGPISSNTTWSVANSPYVVTSNIDVVSNATLTIQPGVTVYVAAGRTIAVQNATLTALGTSANPIVFTSDAVRTGGAGAPGQWGFFTFNPGSGASRVDNAVVEFGQGVVVFGSAPTLNYLDIRNNAGPAIEVNLSASPTGVGNRATGNALNAIQVPAGDITGNVTWGLRGIPYLVASGTVSVGTSPAIASLTPSAIEQGDTVTVTVTGDRLLGASSATFESAGLSAQVLPGGSASQVQLSVTAAANAATGSSALKLLVDAGEARRPAAFNVTGPQFRLASIAPTTIYVNQGDVPLQVTGSQFTNSAEVLVNGAAVATTFVSATRLNATIPNQAAAGALAVRVRMPDPFNAGSFLLSGELALPVVAPSLALAPAQVTVVSGLTRDLSLTLPYAAPAGGQLINLVSSIPGVASVPTTVTVPEGQSSAVVTLTALTTGSTTITASRSGFASAQTLVTVVPPPTLSIAPNSLTVGVGRTAQLTITSSAAAPAGGATVNLTSSSPSIATVPATLTIAAGQTTGSVTLSTLAVGNTTISVQASGYVTGTAQVAVRPVSINFAVGAVVAPGLTRSVPATLSDPAPAGGLTISLTSSNPAILTVPASVVVPAGETLLSIPVTGVALGNATVTASATGYESGTLPMSVEAINITLTGAPTSIPVSMTHVFAVNLSRPAPAGGITVSLASVNPALVTVSPSTVEIPAGQTSGGTVRASLTGVATGATQITATAPGLPNGTLNVTITPQPTLVFSDTTLRVGKGMQTYQYEVYVHLRTGSAQYNPPAGATVTLTSSDPTRFTVPETVTIPAGDYYSYFRVNGVENTTTAGTITASAPGYLSGPLANVTVVSPQPVLTGLLTSRPVNGPREQFSIRLDTPGADYQSNQTLLTPQLLDLSYIDVTPAGLIDGFYTASSGGSPISQINIPAGTNNVTLYLASPTAAGTYRVQASAGFAGTVATSGVVNVAPPDLRFSDTTITVGRGMRTYQYEVYVYRQSGGSNATMPTATTVTLTSSDPTRVSVPATVTIPAGDYYTYFYVNGVDLTVGTPVTISASAAGHNSTVTPITTQVVVPQLQVINLEANRGTGSARDAINVRTNVPGSDYATNQTVLAPVVVDVAVAEASSPGIIDGFYAASTGGSPITQVTIPAGDNNTPNFYVGTPTTGGSYRVQASSAFGTTGLSAVTNVVPPELRFSDTTITVGRGMRTYQYEIYVYRTISGSNFNGTSPVTVNLTSSDPSRASVPATVTIPAGDYYTYFYITGVDLTAGTPVTISANASGYNSPVTSVTTNVVAPTLVFQSVDTPRSPASPRDGFSLRPNVAGSDYSANQTVAAPMVIDLSVIDAAPPGIIDGFYSTATGGTSITQVTMATGTADTPTVYAGSPVSAGSYRMSAVQASTGVTGTSGVVTVVPPELRFSDVTLTVGRGLQTYQYEVYVYRAVSGTNFSGTQPVTVNLACNSTAICTVPASVTIPAGDYYSYFRVNGVGLGTTTITATAPGYNSVQDANVSVVVPELRYDTIPSSVARGANGTVRVGLRTPGADYSNNQYAVAPITVSLTSSAPDVATVSSSVTIAAGVNESANGQITGVAAGTTTVTSSSPGINPVSANVTVNP